MSKRGRRRGRFVLGVAVGAVGMYFLDPDRGRSRSVRVRDQLAKRGRQLQRQRDRARRYEEGVMEGLHHLPSDAPPADDLTLVDRVKSELGHALPHDRVSLDVADGVLELRGELDSDAEIDALIDQVCAVPGVTSLVSLLHLPGEPAPNKAAALDASARLRNR
jgi:BON domain